MEKIDKINIEVALKFLSSVSLLSELDNRVIAAIATHMSLLKYSAGDRVITKGEPGKYMLLIKHGIVNVELDDMGVELGSGAVVGEMSLLSDTPSKANVVAETEIEAFALYRDDFQMLMQKHSALASVMSELMKSRMFGPDGINRIGKYKILSMLGEGGMSVVYNAKDTVLGREVAIKMLRYEIATKKDFKQRFRQEAITIANLKHPYILHVIETIEDYSTEFIVMEKLDGYDLKYMVQNQGVFSPQQTCEVISKVAMALEYAGNERTGGIIHRDIKLANIVLDDMGNVKLMDFGIAVTNGEESDTYEGTLPYMAPEVLQKKPFDYRIDIYALGVTAYAMLTGQTPFMAATANTLIAKHIKEIPPDINAVIPRLPDGLSEFIRLALIKDPKKRISSWVEIQRLLNSGKGGDVHLLDNTNMDMALVIKLQTNKVDTEMLIKDIEQVMKVHHAKFEMDKVTRDDTDVDFEI